MATSTIRYPYIRVDTPLVDLPGASIEGGCEKDHGFAVMVSMYRKPFVSLPLVLMCMHVMRYHVVLSTVKCMVRTHKRTIQR